MLHYFANALTNNRIKNLHCRVILAWPDVDQRLAANLLRRWNPICSPNVLLMAAFIKQDRLTVGVKRPAAGQDTTPNVHSQFDIDSEGFKHLVQLLFGSTRIQGVDHSS